MAKQKTTTVDGILPVRITLTPDQIVGYLSDVLTDIDTDRLITLLKSRIVMELTGQYSDINRLYINDNGDVCYHDYQEYKTLHQISDEAKAAYRRLELALTEVLLYRHDK